LVHLDVGGVDVSFTNSAAWMVIVVLLITAFLTFGMRQRAMVPGRWQSMAELVYEFVAGMVRDNAGQAGMQYFPFVFTLFMFILFSNLLGLLPLLSLGFTVTSHIIVTFALAATVFIGVTLIAIARHGVKFLTFFVPHGVPIPLLLVLVPIELISYCIRPFTLSVRLFANMMAGHTMLNIIATFVIGLGLLAGWAPLAFMVALTGLEVAIACLQAFVFTVLTCIYLNDALHLHH
ncbi:MAG TPA: F0F1 ATP synthase subunit A, partial [Candidatus Cybelea sp.]|nr:F0F1 ATP synthase subunit A [Candidatus Cybelea sp.]